jgi:hypothetical protein
LKVYRAFVRRAITVFALFLCGRAPFLCGLCASIGSVPVVSPAVMSRAGAGPTIASSKTEISIMLDLVYVAGTVLFFALMIAYVAACDRLGRSADVERAPEHSP